MQTRCITCGEILSSGHVCPLRPVIAAPLTPEPSSDKDDFTRMPPEIAEAMSVYEPEPTCKACGLTLAEYTERGEKYCRCTRVLPEPSSAREWWVDEALFEAKSYVQRRMWASDFERPNTVRVVQYAAFEQMRKERDEANKILSSGIVVPAKEWAATIIERDELRRQLAEMSERKDFVTAVRVIQQRDAAWVECDELKRQLAEANAESDAREALERKAKEIKW